MKFHTLKLNFEYMKLIYLLASCSALSWVAESSVRHCIITLGGLQAPIYSPTIATPMLHHIPMAMVSGSILNKFM